MSYALACACAWTIAVQAVILLFTFCAAADCHHGPWTRRLWVLSILTLVVIQLAVFALIFLKVRGPW